LWLAMTIATAHSSCAFLHSTWPMLSVSTSLCGRGVLLFHRTSTQPIRLLVQRSGGWGFGLGGWRAWGSGRGWVGAEARQQAQAEVRRAQRQRCAAQAEAQAQAAR
jgi:hypothetical protein